MIEQKDKMCPQNFHNYVQQGLNLKDLRGLIESISCTFKCFLTSGHSCFTILKIAKRNSGPKGENG